MAGLGGRKGHAKSSRLGEDSRGKPVCLGASPVGALMFHRLTHSVGISACAEERGMDRLGEVVGSLETRWFDVEPQGARTGETSVSRMRGASGPRPGAVGMIARVLIGSLK